MTKMEKQWENTQMHTTKIPGQSFCYILHFSARLELAYLVHTSLVADRRRCLREGVDLLEVETAGKIGQTVE